MYTPHTVTLYYATEDPVTFTQLVNITILHGVFFDAAKAANVRTSGLEGADSVNLFIPFGVDAYDGLYAGLDEHPRKKFVGPKEYEAAADKSGLWTMDVGVNCFFVKGEVVEPGKSFQYINANYDDVYKVTKVDEKDFGSPAMQHWEVGGA